MSVFGLSVKFGIIGFKGPIFFKINSTDLIQIHLKNEDKTSMKSIMICTTIEFMLGEAKTIKICFEIFS